MRGLAKGPLAKVKSLLGGAGSGVNGVVKGPPRR